MKTKIYWITLILSLILAACGTTTLTPEPMVLEPSLAAPTNTSQPIAEPTTPVDQPADSATELPTAVETTMDGCTLQTALQPSAESANSRFPAVTESDWQIGPADAATTIVEYGDFQ